MSSLGDAIGQQANWLTGDEGKYEVQRLVKNRALQGRLNDALVDFDSTKSASSKALDQYIKDFLAGSSTATARSKQEQSVIDRYYNGDIENQLADFRRRRTDASQQALSRALAYAQRNRNLSLIGGAGGGSSYDRQLALKAGTDLNLQTLMDNLNAERGDWDWLNRSQLGLAGQRTAMADALAARSLVPANAMKSNLGWDMSTLGDLIRMDQANKFYGVQYKPTTGEEIGQHVGDLANAAMQAYSMYAGGGMGGGGGQQQSRLPSTTPTWSPAAMPQTGSSGWGMSNYPSVGAGLSVSPYGQPATSSGYELPPLGSTYQSYVPNGWGYGGQMQFEPTGVDTGWVDTLLARGYR